MQRWYLSAAWGEHVDKLGPIYKYDIYIYVVCICMLICFNTASMLCTHACIWAMAHCAAKNGSLQRQVHMPEPLFLE